MNKENIPGYHASQCCRTCTFWSEKIYNTWDNTERQTICRKYNRDIQDYAVCDSFEYWSPDNE